MIHPCPTLVGTVMNEHGKALANPNRSSTGDRDWLLTGATMLFVVACGILAWALFDLWCWDGENTDLVTRFYYQNVTAVGIGFVSATLFGVQKFRSLHGSNSQ